MVFLFTTPSEVEDMVNRNNSHNRCQNFPSLELLYEKMILLKNCIEKKNLVEYCSSVVDLTINIAK